LTVPSSQHHPGLPPEGFWKKTLLIATLSCLAIAQPLFDVIGRYPTFFVANRLLPVDIYALVAGICVVFPLLLSIVTRILGAINRRAEEWSYRIEIAVLSGTAILPFAKVVHGIPGIFLVVLSFSAGTGIAFVYERFIAARKFLMALSVALVAIPAYFIFLTPVSTLLFGGASQATADAGKSHRPPVVMVVFDEFSLVSLLNEHQTIDSLRFPNISLLAQNTTWFRNATTVSTQTEYAVPAILSGRRPLPGSVLLPTLHDYPDNVFTLLGPHYQMQVYESQTSLCPPQYAGTLQPLKPFRARIESMASDLGVIYRKIVLPDDLTRSLPSVEHTWGKFSSRDSVGYSRDNSTKSISNGAKLIREMDYNRRILWDNFLSALQPSAGNAFYFLHILLPHYEWEYTPSGKSYLLKSAGIPPIPGLKGEDWGDDSWAVLQAQQRYLLQVRALDGMVGELVRKLKDEGLYDSSLLIITADHGVSFVPNDSRRFLTASNYPDILPVPLFIKTPFEHSGSVNDRNAETIDILPTIAAVTGLPLPRPLDGSCLFDTSLSERPEKKVFLAEDPAGYRIFPKSIDEKVASVKRQIQYFGTGSQPYGLYTIGPHSELIGRDVNVLPILKSNITPISIDHRDYYSSIDPDAPGLLAQISGRMHDRDPHTPVSTLAIAVNGTIRAMTRTYIASDGEFTAMVPDDCLHAGKNSIQAYILRDTAGTLTLIQPEHDVSYTLTGEAGSTETLTSPDGQKAKIGSGTSDGSIDSIYCDNGRLWSFGWAARFSASQLPIELILFSGDRFLEAIPPGNQIRPDLAREHHDEKLVHAGWSFDLHGPEFNGSLLPHIRVFALYADGSCAELHSPVRDRSLSASPDIHPVAMYSLATGRHGSTTLRGIDDKLYVVANAGSAGTVDTVESESDGLSIYGWALQAKQHRLPRQVVVFLDGNYVCSDTCGNFKRPEIGVKYSNPLFANAGFRIRIDSAKLHFPLKIKALRVFALYGDRNASEVPHHFRDFTMAKHGTSPTGTTADLLEIRFGNRVFPIVKGIIEGHLDIWRQTADSLQIAGWAADIKHGHTIDAVIMTVNGSIVKTIRTGRLRKDISQGYKEKALDHCGFNETFSINGLGLTQGKPKVRLYAVSVARKSASEIRYTLNFPYQ
jgi:hypothetical protein